VEEEKVGGMSGFIRSIEGVCLAATLREDVEAGKIFISVRAVPGYDAAVVCEKFSGGGHKGAGGGSTTLPLAQAKEKMIEALLEQM
jgi:phosphoesterase RecJ-like protein